MKQYCAMEDENICRGEQDRRDAKKFVFMKKVTWGHEVKKQARVILNERRMNTKPQLPLPGTLSV